MNFLAPAFLFGALAIGLPVLFHLIRRSTRERKLFSSLMFLVPSPPRLSRRSRLEHLLLLCLRCAAIVLIAAGFARPYWRTNSPPAPNSAPVKRTLLLLDTSASMRRQGLWAQVQARAHAVVAQASPLDQVALFTFDRQLKPIVTFDQWNAASPGDRLNLVRSRLATVQPGWAATQLDSALIQAAELLAENDKETVVPLKQLILLTDLQEGSQTRALQGHQWPNGVQVLLERVLPASPNNAGIQLVADSADTNFTSDSAIRVRVINAADSKKEQIQAGWAGAQGTYLGKPVDLYVPAGQSRVVSIPAPPTNAPADRILLRGDDEPFDNTVFVLPPQPTQVTVLYLGNDLAGDARQPLFFLQRAFQPTRGQTIRVKAQSVSAPLTADAILSAGLVVLTGLPDETHAAALRDGLSRGGLLLFAPPNAPAFEGLGKVLGLEGLKAEEARVADYALLGEINFRHPLFASFADARFSDFTKIHFWKYRKLSEAELPGTEVLARFDNGDPAILQTSLGRGRIISLASGWHPADSQLAVSSKFVPLLYSLLDLGRTTPAPAQQHFVGDNINLGQTASILLPDGTRVQVQTNFTQTLIPGIYTAESGLRFAVNLAPAESRTTPLPPDELDRLRVPAPNLHPTFTPPAERQARLQNTDLEARQKMWRWFLLVALGVLAVETWLAGRTARGRAQEVAA